MEGFDTRLWKNGPAPGELYNFPGFGAKDESVPRPIKHTQCVYELLSFIIMGLKAVIQQILY